MSCVHELVFSGSDIRMFEFTQSIIKFLFVTVLLSEILS